MYIKYHDPVTRAIQVRDVRHFAIYSQDCEEEDGSVTHGAAIYDGMVERAACFAGVAVESAAAFLLDSTEAVWRMQHRRRDPVLSVSRYYDDAEVAELAWFNSRDAAEAVMEDICEALAYGKQFFDLAEYGEAGNVNV